MKNISDSFGVLDIDQKHIEVSSSEIGAKYYAKRNGYAFVTVRRFGTEKIQIISRRLYNKWYAYSSDLMDQEWKLST